MTCVMTQETISLVFPLLNKASNIMLIYILVSVYLEFVNAACSADFARKTVICQDYGC